MRHHESKIQIACVNWFRAQFPMYVIYSVPNGGKRTRVEAGILKAEGQLSGVSDLVVMFGNKEYHSLYIEMKTEKGRQSENQKAFERKCKIFKFKYVICTSLEEFIHEVNNYIKSI